MTKSIIGISFVVAFFVYMAIGLLKSLQLDLNVFSVTGAVVVIAVAYLVMFVLGEYAAIRCSER